jgi:hypothetical protein
MPGILSAAKRGFRFSVKLRFGIACVIMYGPTPGGRLLERFFIGVPVGTRAAAGNAIAFENAP